MQLMTEQPSKKLFELVEEWKAEFFFNIEHNTERHTAWNALVLYMMDLEKGANHVVPSTPRPDSSSDL